MVTLRRAEKSDCSAILEMIIELAVFEKEPDAVEAKLVDLEKWGFGDHPVFRVLIAERGATPLGFVLYFPTFSTWTGQPGIHIEDLYVREDARGTGAGRMLVAAVAAECISIGGRRLDLSVLNWNPARSFYQRLGFNERTEWLGYRLEGSALQAIASDGGCVRSD